MTFKLKLKEIVKSAYGVVLHRTNKVVEEVEVMALGLYPPPRESKSCQACGAEIGDRNYGIALCDTFEDGLRSLRVCSDCLADTTDVPAGDAKTSKEPAITAERAQTIKRLQHEMIERVARQVDNVSVKPSCYRVVEISRILSETAERIRKLARDEVDK